MWLVASAPYLPNLPPVYVYICIYVQLGRISEPSAVYAQPIRTHSSQCYDYFPLLLVCLPYYKLSATSSVPPIVTGDFSRFPDQAVVAEEDYDYFISDLNFDVISGKLLVGAA